MVVQVVVSKSSASIAMAYRLHRNFRIVITGTFSYARSGSQEGQALSPFDVATER